MSHPAPARERGPQAVRSFIDLRGFAAVAQLGPARRGGTGDAFRDARQYLDLPEGPVSVGLMTFDRQDGRADGMVGDEFIIVLAGELTIDADATRLTLTTDQSAVIPAGCRFSWRAAAGTKALFMTCATAARATAGPMAIDASGPLAPSNPPVAELLVGSTPRCRNRTDYRSADGEFMCGVWDSTPYHRLSMPYRHYELMHLLAGAVTFEDGAGRRATFSKGDIFLVEQGAECSWLSETDVAKVFAIYRPA